MGHQKINPVLTFILSISLLPLSAQNALNAGGGVATGGSGSVSYSVGQVFYNNNSGSGGSISEGVQHPYRISITTQLEEKNGVRLTCSAFPNPSDGFLNLKIENYRGENIHYQLINLNGQVLDQGQVSSGQSRLELVSFARGIYFLKVHRDNEEIQSFKIIKQ